MNFLVYISLTKLSSKHLVMHQNDKAVVKIALTGIEDLQFYGFLHMNAKAITQGTNTFLYQFIFFFHQGIVSGLLVLYTILISVEHQVTKFVN